MFPWAGLATLCPRAGLAVGLGPALSRQALHGGKANNDTSDAHKIARLLRGGLLPPPSVAPAARRTPRALWRRRMPLMRQRAARLAQVPTPHRQDHGPESGKKRASHAHRAGVAARFPASAVQNRDSSQNSNPMSRVVM